MIAIKLYWEDVKTGHRLSVFQLYLAKKYLVSGPSERMPRAAFRGQRCRYLDVFDIYVIPRVIMQVPWPCCVYVAKLALSKDTL